MSQQEFMPESESHRQHPLNSEDEIYYPQHPYYWSVKPENEGAPRDEPPSSFAGSTAQPGYQAQDYASSMKQEEYKTSTEGQQWSGTGTRQQFAPDGDAFEQGYRPYNSYNFKQGVPPFAQTAGYNRLHRKSPLRLIFFVLLVFLLIKPILILGGLLIGGALLLLVLLPLALLALGIFRMAFWPGWNRYHRHRGNFWYRRGGRWM